LLFEKWEHPIFRKAKIMKSIRTKIVSLPILFALVACGSSVIGQQPSPFSSEPGLVQGVALGIQGKPVAGATIWVRPSLTTGLLQTTTDAQGRYKVKGISTIPYNAYAWYRQTYRGKNVCLRLAPEQLAGYDSFIPEKGAVKNFKLQITGEIPDNTSAHFGGEFRVFLPATPAGSRVELNLVPDGALLDGSIGQAKKIVLNDVVQSGIPIGVYTTTATLIEANGSRSSLEISADDNSYASRTTLQWQSEGNCVGSTASGTDRAFLWLRVPQ
jgi:hypothetical protein